MHECWTIHRISVESHRQTFLIAAEIRNELEYVYSSISKQ